MAQVTHGGTIATGALPADVYALIDNASVSNIANADISATAAIADTKLAQLTTASKVSAGAVTGLMGSIEYVIDGGGAAITTGVKGDLEIPFACTITRVTITSDTSCTAVVDIWKDTYANFPPTDADSITASAVPTITTSTKNQDATLTGWTTAITAGDILRFNVDSNNNATRILISLKYTRTTGNS